MIGKYINELNRRELAELKESYIDNVLRYKTGNDYERYQKYAEANCNVCCSCYDVNEIDAYMMGVCDTLVSDTEIKDFYKGYDLPVYFIEEAQLAEAV